MKLFIPERKRFYAGVDLHARSMHVCIIDESMRIVFHRDLPAAPGPFLAAIDPWKEGLVVGVECVFSWYWLADLCDEHGIEFVLGHALYMKLIHGAKTKNDRIDSEKLARLLRGGNFPRAYVYPAPMRSTRDLLRRRTYLVRRRGEALAHIKNTNSQYNLPPFSKRMDRACHREGITECFADPAVARSIESDCTMLDAYDEEIRKLELYVTRCARVHDPATYHRLRTITGVGKILALILLYEIHAIERFPRVQQFVSYCRLVKCSKESAGKIKGTAGRKIGNAHLKWAFSEAAVIMTGKSAAAKQFVDRKAHRYGKGKALSILAARIARATYFILKRQQPFDERRLFAT